METLVFYEYTTSDVLIGLDFGAVAPRSSADTMLRIGNPSDIYQAEDVIVTVADDADGGQLWISLDGDVFGTSIDLGDVPPNSVSGPFWLRRVTASTQADGECAATLRAYPTAWVYPIDNNASQNMPLNTPDNPPDD